MTIQFIWILLIFYFLSISFLYNKRPIINTVGISLRIIAAFFGLLNLLRQRLNWTSTVSFFPRKIIVCQIYQQLTWKQLEIVKIFLSAVVWIYHCTNAKTKTRYSQRFSDEGNREVDDQRLAGSLVRGSASQSLIVWKDIPRNILHAHIIKVRVPTNTYAWNYYSALQVKQFYKYFITILHVYHCYIY